MRRTIIALTMSNGGSGVSEYAGQLQKFVGKKKKKEKKKENSNSYSFRLVVALRLNFL